MNYKVVLIIAMPESDSVIHTYLFFFTFFSIRVYHSIPTMVPWAVQEDLVYPAYT